MTMITADTPWKATGDTDAESLRTEFATRGIPGRTSPLAVHAAEIQRAASPYSRLLAAMSWVEQKHATYFESPIPADFHNFMSMAQGWDPAIGGHTWYHFDSYADCAAFWKARLESPTGPYAQDVTIRELITTYAPPGPPDFNRTEEYIQDVVAVINRLRLAGTAERPAVFGNVPNPGIAVRLIDKPENHGWNDRGPRNIVGVCVHRMLGTLEGTDGHFRLAGVDALTDFGIGGAMDPPAQDGAIWQWNSLKGNRRPWASGWAEHEDPDVVAEGHGREFRDIWRHQGYDLNRDLASIELSGCTSEIAEWTANGTPIWADWCGRVETPVTPKQFEALAALIAYVADRYCRISYKDFPFNPNVGEGFYAVYQHFEFAGKNCPYSTVRGLHEDYVARAKEILQHYQTQGAAEFTPFASPRVFHIRPDARGTGRPEPHLGSAWVRLFGPGEAVETDGIYRGAVVAGEPRWLRTADADHLAIHASAFAEAI
jgi:hypothetical protein